MEYREFIHEIRNRIQEIVGIEAEVSEYETLKNNSVRREGITIREKASRVGPTIYLEDFFSDYCDGVGMEEIVNDILRIYSDNREGHDFDVDGFSDFDSVRDRIFFKLVNTEKNKKLLGMIPHYEVMDLSVIFAVNMGTYKDGVSSVMVKNEHLEMWGVTEDDIRKIAFENTPRLMPLMVWPMVKLLEEMGVTTGDDYGEVPMWVISNKDRINGGAVMLYDGAFNEICEKAGSLYVLPSSVHELILVPADSIKDEECLRDMVAEVNDTQVSREEVLSYSLYRYDYGIGISMVA